jgi:hypothetical protein
VQVLIVVVLVPVIGFYLFVEDEYDDENEYDFRKFKELTLLVGSQRGARSPKPLLIFEKCVFNGLHPLGWVGHFEGGGVFLILII